MVSRYFQILYSVKFALDKVEWKSNSKPLFATKELIEMNHFEQRCAKINSIDFLWANGAWNVVNLGGSVWFSMEFPASILCLSFRCFDIWFVFPELDIRISPHITPLVLNKQILWFLSNLWWIPKKALYFDDVENGRILL